MYLLIHSTRTAVAGFALLVGTVACSSPSTPTPRPPALALTCPAPVVLESAPSIPATVTYASPLATGGTAPVSVTCTPASGTAFGLGQANVVCTAADSGAPQSTATCGFSVTVRQTFSVGATKFLAFGDSITAGVVEYNDALASILAVEVDKAYPTKLSALMRERYPQQTITVVNEGFQGEPAGCAPGSTFCGANRISRVLETHQPDALLLLQGVVDLATGHPSALSQMLEGLKFGIRDAKRRGVSHVFVGTLLPEKNGSRSYAIDMIVPANREIRELVSAEGVNLVDVYAGMVGQEPTLIGKDGLHPSPEGYDVMARIFFDAIRARLETVVTTPTGLKRILAASSPPGPHVEVGPQLRRPAVRMR